MEAAPQSSGGALLAVPLDQLSRRLLLRRVLVVKDQLWLGRRRRRRLLIAGLALDAAPERPTIQAVKDLGRGSCACEWRVRVERRRVGLGGAALGAWRSSALGSAPESRPSIRRGAGELGRAERLSGAEWPSRSGLSWLPDQPTVSARRKALRTELLSDGDELATCVKAPEAATGRAAAAWPQRERNARARGRQAAAGAARSRPRGVDLATPVGA